MAPAYITVQLTGFIFLISITTCVRSFQFSTPSCVNTSYINKSYSIPSTSTISSEKKCRVRVNPQARKIETKNKLKDSNIKPYHALRVSNRVSNFIELLNKLGKGLPYLSQKEIILLQKALAITIRVQMNASGTREGRRRAENSVDLCLLLGELDMDIEMLLAAMLVGTTNPKLGPLKQTSVAGAKFQDLKRHFGIKVVRLIESFEHVTHLESLAQHHMTQRSLEVNGIITAEEKTEQLDQLRNLILSEVADWRVVALRVASHLQTMRIMAKNNEPKLRLTNNKLAIEALSLHAPLAHRLGIHQLVAELQDLAFKRRYPRQNAKIREHMTAHKEAYQAVHDKATKDLTKALESNDEFMSQMESVTLVGRTKEPFSMWRKVLRQKNRNVEEVSDAVALRVVFKAIRLPNETDAEYDSRSASLCYDAIRIIEKCYPTVESRNKDYVKYPKANGYRSLHATALMECDLKDGKEKTVHPFEVQVRTSSMHQQAEYGVAAHWAYKGEGSSSIIKQNLKSKSLSTLDSRFHVPIDFANGCEFVNWLHEQLQSQKVFVFGPDGLIWDLEKNAATAKDINRRLYMKNFYTGGKSSVEIMVQGMQVPYDYVLRNGDAISVA